MDRMVYEKLMTLYAIQSHLCRVPADPILTRDRSLQVSGVKSVLRKRVGGSIFALRFLAEIYQPTSFLKQAGD